MSVVDRNKAVMEFTEESLGQKMMYDPESPMTREQVVFVCAKVMEEMLELAMTLPEFYCKDITNPKKKYDIKMESKAFLLNILFNDKLCRLPSEEHLLDQNTPKQEKIAAQADALCDMLIFIENASCKKGWNMNDIFSEVHEANMRKRWPEDNVFHRDDIGKVVKPPGWIGPDILKVVKSWSK